MSNHTSESAPVQLSLETTEHWKDIPGYEKLYAVSDRGKVYAYKTKCMMKPGISRGGYLRLYLVRNKSKKKYSVHRLVLLAFEGECPQGKVVNHINRIKTDNRLVNLQYVTYKENTIPAYRGEKHHKAKLTEEQAKAILNLFKVGKLSSAAIARQYGISKQSALAIKHRKTWTHLD